MTNSGDSPNQHLFAGTAWYYARYRPGYPQAFFDDLIQRFNLNGTGRLLDLGCGSGQLTIPLARHVTEAIGVDPEPGMLTEASNKAQTAQVTNVTWAQGSSTDLPGRLGQFRLVTMGRSFHWMDREQVLTALASMVDDDGGIVIANDGCLVRPTTTWQHAVEDIQHRFLGPIPKIAPKNVIDTHTHEPHEMLLARSAFRKLDRVVHKFERTWTPEQIIGYLYSTSLPLRRLLGDQQTAFEQAVTDTLHSLDQEGRFVEPVSLEVLIARKES
ncbi:class I SAM-dependent methyltransferase [Nonomuraea sp. NPDC049400]|uniref:class I SAM-dependent methyltransferase n=1 Tax=Nonomuraea sp. NPDC049400 TaxID=3364352 RepID=UPI0037960A21